MQWEGREDPGIQDYEAKATSEEDSIARLLMMAAIDDCYTSVRDRTANLGNFVKATFDAISKTYSFLTPDLWKQTVFTESLYQEFTDHLVKTHTRVSVQRTQAPAVATT
ncbi:hypothetical protein A6R68_02552 [Neotoma lepida]|uniref:Small ribosomal subunit protein uS5 C-terminal domain-containing protein n=1 Tax=Neotoma lepida TaxID=56216 RepID=A0A1A6GRH3_NEOLE|nr:hypothetical protein A6R68_02552 [Neotoma lepida]